MIHTLLNARPPARGDGVPWNRARVEQAVASTGPWTTMATLALSPLDTNPLTPQDRNLTFDSTLTVGYFRVVWLDAADGTSVPGVAVYDDGLSTGEPSLPSVADVARLLRARTTDSSGTEVGDFTTATRPTAAAVAALVTEAGRQVEMLTGPIPGEPTSLNVAARHVIALRTVLLIELTYWPEQVRDDRSAYTHYKELYDEGLVQLGKAVQEAGAGDVPGSVDDSVGPVFFFPEDVGGLVGWETDW